jgi:4-hydroxybenzoate polyprenyltransferase
MKKALRDLLRLLRPRQWIKNLAIFAAITFNGGLLDPTAFTNVFYGFLIFCAISSGIYVINDIFDVKKDRLHPFKRFRPLASNDISIPTAIGIAAILISSGMIASYFLNTPFFLITLAYLLLQIFYSLYLKHVAVIDILGLAGGYILRVYAGELVAGAQYHISVWLLLTTISLSLFLAVGKRRRELTLVSEHNTANIAAIRRSLSHYSERLLDVYASIFATSTFISYALFTFVGFTQNNSFTNDILLPDYLPESLQGKKWIMLSILPVVYGLMRYLQDIYEKHEGESPEKVLFSDKSLLATVIIWILLVVGIIYFPFL